MEKNNTHNDSWKAVKMVVEAAKTPARRNNMSTSELREAINDYKIHGASPKQVVGDDTVAGVYSTSDQFNRISLSY